jgi:hypothetical protein
LQLEDMIAAFAGGNIEEIRKVLQVLQASVPGMVTTDDGNFVDVFWQVVSIADGTIFTMTDEHSASFLTIAGISMSIGHAGPGSGLTLQPATIMAPNLPTVDPNNAGQLWNSGGVVHVSAG